MTNTGAAVLRTDQPQSSYSQALDRFLKLKQFYSSRKDETGVNLTQDLIVHKSLQNKLTLRMFTVCICPVQVGRKVR